MKPINSNIKNLKYVLGKLPGVKAVKGVKIKDEMIEKIFIEKEMMGKLTLQRINIRDAKALFDFYFKGLSAKSRNLFPPYPLFSPLPTSVADLADKIRQWQKEKDWTVLKMKKDKKIIAIGLLKRYQTKRPRSGLAVREMFQNRGLGTILQTIINEQARLLNLNIVYASASQDNFASQRVHENCGFQKTGKLIPHFAYQNGKKIIDRYDVEMVKKIK